ncbi:hypothetical protein WR25_22760 [Diploscapter pachys]|uniref:Uncharacterized protein n=1 Tax=Diploscapter pachys TaxID=2018661 RepID=A0A2A2KPN3_9BILA|nr:hypothetical protein WR25_22760 [Diploscapter pachys]
MNELSSESGSTEDWKRRGRRAAVMTPEELVNKKRQLMLMIVGLSQSEAQRFLEAADGDVQRAANMILDERERSRYENVSLTDMPSTSGTSSKLLHRPIPMSYPTDSTYSSHSDINLGQPTVVDRHFTVNDVKSQDLQTGSDWSRNEIAKDDEVMEATEESVKGAVEAERAQNEKTSRMVKSDQPSSKEASMIPDDESGYKPDEKSLAELARFDTPIYGVSSNSNCDYIEVPVKLLYPETEVATPMQKICIKQLFIKSYDVTIGEKIRVPKAAYEMQFSEFKLIVRFDLYYSFKAKDQKAARIVQLANMWCKESAYGFHEQLYIQLPTLPNMLDNLCHQYSSIDIAAIAIGHCPNAGVFFVRGDYFTRSNQPSNPALSRCNTTYARNTSANVKNLQGYEERDKQYHAAGRHDYLSFANFEHDRKQMTIYFAVKLRETNEDGLDYIGYRISMPYSSIIKIVADFGHSDTDSIYFWLKHPATLYECMPENAYNFNGQKYINMEKCREWVRRLEWIGDEYAVGCSKQSLADSQWLRLTTMKKDRNGSNRPSESLVEILARITTRVPALVWFGAIHSLRRPQPTITEVSSVGSFRADYCIKAMISRGSVVTDQLFDWNNSGDAENPFFAAVKRAMHMNQAAAEEALENLLNAVDERRQMDLKFAFEKLFWKGSQEYCQGTAKFVTNSSLPKNCVLIRKVMVTPLRVMFMAPEVMMANRVVRHFGEQYALRCVFRDDRLENNQKLSIKDFNKGGSVDQNSILADMIRKTLTNGVEICGRTYHFLAWSNSQMRDHGCYMYAPSPDPVTGEWRTIEDMRKWMGDFSSVRNVPKLMSRMGQCFTQAQPTVVLRQHEWTVEPDIEGGTGHPETGEPYCFSDGCGRLSFGLAKEIALALELKVIPSCFQVRFKGIKGVIAIDPSLDWHVKGYKAVFRKSQMKFTEDEREEDVIEVIKYAMPSPMCLNRPMITIMDHVSEKQSKAVHQRVCQKIHYYLEKELSFLGSMLISERAAAEQLMQRITVVTMDFQHLRRCGISLTKEPFIRRMLVAVYRNTVINHLTKAKIFLPSQMGRSMYGVVDETSLLQYGQVFIQLSPNIRQSSLHPVPYLGKVLITKNPCHVAGDVRMFEAVWQPSLAHLFDVVVFPQNGPRPHPDEMAGSDLDGDEYSVVFDPDLFLLHNEKPMIFPKVRPDEYEETPTTTEMVNFFLDYLRQDSIGRVSNAHLKMADRKGLFCPEANSIARKCSIAVDFPKTGVPAEQLTAFEQIQCEPDYMGVSSAWPQYRSNRLNGQLYRKAKRVEELLGICERTDSIWEQETDEHICPPEVDLFEGEGNKRREALRLRNEYAVRMQQLLDDYAIAEEAWVVSGHIVTLKRLAGMEKDDYSFYHTDKIVELRYAKIYEQFRKIFFEVMRDANFLSLDCPLGERLNVEIRNHIERNKVDFDDFCARFCDDQRNQGVVRYSLFYGARDSSLLMAMYVLYWWLNEEKIFEIDGVQMSHVGLLFIQNCLGIHQGTINDLTSSENIEVLFREKPNYSVTEARSWLDTFNVGEAILNFLRYVASQRFAMAGRMCLSIFDDAPYQEPILLRPRQWVGLSQIAFRTYHLIAVSGRFDALHIGNVHTSFIQSESREPIVVNASLLSSNEAPPIQMHQTLNALSVS